MAKPFILPENFETHLGISNARERLEEAREVANKITESGICLLPNMDHIAIFTDPPSLLAGPLKKIGYIAGWDTRCYPSPVDGQDYINVPSGLPKDSPERNKGWPDYVAVVYPVDEPAKEQMLSQGYGNPFIHHLTWGIKPPDRKESNDIEYATQIIPFMINVRKKIGVAIGNEPGTLIMALPPKLILNPKFTSLLPSLFGNLDRGEYQIEAMQDGGFLIQFFVLTGGRIEVALRFGTQQTFNPKSVHKISEDEISTEQSN